MPVEIKFSDGEHGDEYDKLKGPEEEHFDIMSTENNIQLKNVDYKRSRYPYCIVWTPIPLLTWLFPFIGHMGICYTTGVIRDFAGSYFVSEDNMGFGRPTRYLRLDPTKVKGINWDRAVYEASEEYKSRTHNLICDNCHSHVALALNLMEYKNMRSWNMVYLALMTFVCAKYVGFAGFLKTWLPSIIIYTIIIIIVLRTAT